MSEDEVLVLLAAGAVALIGWGTWYYRLAVVESFGRGRELRLGLALLPAPPLLGILIVLLLGASFDVRRSPTYLFLYVVLGAAWLAAGRGLLGLALGVSWRDDALERRNPAAAAAVAGALAGLAACYAGGNVGDGPGWWCVVVAAGQACCWWFVLQRPFLWFAATHRTLAVERDLAAGVRLAGYLLASGIICGRGAAGDWISLERTLAEFGDVLFGLLPLAALAWVVEWRARRAAAGRPAAEAWGQVPASAWYWAASYVALALVALYFAPPLTQDPRYGAGG